MRLTYVRIPVNGNGFGSDEFSSKTPLNSTPSSLGCTIAGRASFCPFLGPRMKLGVGTPQGHDCLTKQGEQGFLPRS